MRLNLRTFLILSLLLGAVAIPLGYKYFKARRKAEIERLEKEMAELGTRLISIPDISDDPDPKFLADCKRWEKRARTIEARLEKLTGKKPERPVPDIYGPPPTAPVMQN